MCMKIIVAVQKGITLLLYNAIIYLFELPIWKAQTYLRDNTKYIRQHNQCYHSEVQFCYVYIWVVAMTVVE